MKLLLTRYLFLSLISATLFGAQSFGQKSTNENSSALISVDTTTPLLYHASFKVLKYQFTGLVVFKNISDEEGIRIVFLSEAGLSIAEYTYLNNKVECLHTLPMVDRKAAKRYLSGIVYLLLSPANCHKQKVKPDRQNTSYICKGNKGKHYYIYRGNKLEKIIFKKGLRKNATAFLENELVANKVEIRKCKKVQVEMKLVENAIK